MRLRSRRGLDARARQWQARRMPAVAPLVDDSMVIRRVVVPKRDVVFIRGVLEASDGVGWVFALKGGDLTIAGCPSRARELDQVLADLRREIGSAWIDLDSVPIR